MSKSLRADMPTVAGWIDEMRDAFGAAEINASIRAGIDGQASFYASENGIEVGSRPAPGAAVSLADIHLGPLVPANRRKDM